MSFSKKYVYVHSCSKTITADNFRNVLGRTWVDSFHSGLQYGYDVDPPPFNMTFGPMLEWSHEYFNATEIPAKTQIVSIKPNPVMFPFVETATEQTQERILGTVIPEERTRTVVTEDPCCGWNAYLKTYFESHFSTGNPLQLLRKILQARVKHYEKAVAEGTIQDHEDMFFSSREPCGGRGGLGVVEGDLAGSSDTTALGETDAEYTAWEEMAMEITAAMTAAGTHQVRLFRDLWFQSRAPLSQREDEAFEGVEKALASDVSFNYNFFLEEYEQQLTKQELPEIRIPSLHLITTSPGSVPYVTYLQNNVGCRYQEFSKLVLQNGYRELLIPIKQLPYLQDKNIYSTSFPMDAKISFGTDRNTFVADSLEDSKMECAMLRRLSEGEVLLDVTESSSQPYSRSTMMNHTPPKEENLDFTSVKTYYSTTDLSKSKPSQARTSSLQTFDFYQWLMSLPDLPPSSVSLPEDHIFLGNQNDSTDVAFRSGLYRPDMSFLANYFVLSGKINEIAKIHLRSYQQMMRGDDPHSETIAYRISKYSTAALGEVFRAGTAGSSDTTAIELEGMEAMASMIIDNMFAGGDPYGNLEEAMDQISSSGVEPIQNVWIPNSNTVDVIEYVDTQLKYNTGYTYIVTAYQLSVGTEYFYSQYSKFPEPEACTSATTGINSIIGPYTFEQVARLLEVSLNPAFSEGAKYQEIMSRINSNLDPRFTCEGTGIGLAKRTAYPEPGFSTSPSGEVEGGATGTDEYIVYCYCHDNTLPEDSSPTATPWETLGVVLNVPLDESAGADSGTACRIFGELEEQLKAQLGIADVSPGTLAALQAAGFERPTIEYSNSSKVSFNARTCPDDWTEGQIQTSTRESSGTRYIDLAGGLEAKYLGKQEFTAMCECPPAENCSESFLVTTIPSLKVHQVPYLMWSGKVTDTPPVGPDVEVVPYRATNNELLFLLGAGVGSYTTRPIPISSRDRNKFKALLRDQKSKDGLVEFRSDDPVKTFQTFKLTKKPEKYSDFARGEIRTIKVSSRSGQDADSASFIEPLSPNQKYYYIFRSMDIHGHISNPTPIYEIEIVDSDGAIYPLINIYEPDNLLPVDLSKQAQRLIQVRPDFLQSVVNPAESGLSEATSARGSGRNVKLGVREENLWDRKFKLRLTSCETRRLLDINLKFKTKHLTAEQCSPADDRSTLNEGLDIPAELDELTGGETTSDPTTASTSTTTTSPVDTSEASWFATLSTPPPTMGSGRGGGGSSGDGSGY